MTRTKTAESMVSAENMLPGNTVTDMIMAVRNKFSEDIAQK